MDVGNFSPFYSTSSPNRAAALLPKGIQLGVLGSTEIREEQGKELADHLIGSFYSVIPRSRGKLVNPVSVISFLFGSA